MLLGNVGKESKPVGVTGFRALPNNSGLSKGGLLSKVDFSHLAPRFPQNPMVFQCPQN
jgi:hypothetical protein